MLKGDIKNQNISGRSSRPLATRNVPCSLLETICRRQHSNRSKGDRVKEGKLSSSKPALGPGLYPKP